MSKKNEPRISHITVEGAREHNLKNISVSIPRNTLTVITGLSGSGKSSLAFDVIYAEGQRRYLETLNAYARQFLGSMQRPDVDYVGGLSPVISIEQRTTGRNRRSTVGTITEIYDFLRLLYSRTATAYSPTTGEPLQMHSDEQIIALILKEFEGKKVALCSPLVKGRKGHYENLFASLSNRGFLHVRVDGKIVEITPKMRIDRYATHDIELVVDRLEISHAQRERISQSLPEALRQGDGVAMVIELPEGTPRHYSRKLMCPTSGMALPNPEPHTFSFNSPYGACPQCRGLGWRIGIHPDHIIENPELPAANGGIRRIIERTTHFDMLMQLTAKWLKTHNVDPHTPVGQIPPESWRQLLWGEEIAPHPPSLQECFKKNLPLPGLIPLLDDYYDNTAKGDISPEIRNLMEETPCPLCLGTRLREESLCFKIDGLTIAEASDLSLDDFAAWSKELESRLEGAKRIVATEILKEIRSRVDFLREIGLEYLSLSRPADSLSGGESQRIRLATQIGTNLVNVLYILDEPSIGLHPRDNTRLINALKQLRDQNNTILVVEHDEEIMRAADYIVDLGPGAGRFGGEVVAKGTPQEILQADSLTARYLRGETLITPPAERRRGNGKEIIIHNATGNNLKGVTAHFPLGQFICVTGVSGSGKSTLINDTLYPITSQHLYRSHQRPLPYEKVEGLEHIDKVIQVDQSPLGRTPRSNPATYTGLFTDIRKLFAATPEAEMRGYSIGRFSFNVKGGRCEACKGAGVEVIEMNYLPNVHVKCSQCHGERYNRETLAVRYKGKSIGQVLDMTINQAAEFFASVPSLARRLAALQSVGMGYVKLGQPSTTLSGGESQRIRLAEELGKRDSGNTLYILDEPTTGLHFEDIRLLLKVIDQLTERGNTVVVIEHNLDVIKMADHLIDLGPESGAAGGEIVVTGTPEEVATSGKGHTAQYLAEALHKQNS